jgi:hypothetical protein
LNLPFWDIVYEWPKVSLDIKTPIFRPPGVFIRQQRQAKGGIKNSNKNAWYALGIVRGERLEDFMGGMAIYRVIAHQPPTPKEISAQTMNYVYQPRDVASLGLFAWIDRDPFSARG